MNSCNEEQTHKANGTYLGGQIVNATSNVVIIRKEDQIIDSIFLDQNNMFLYQFKNFTPGLYDFFHNERQQVFLEEGDSLLLHVNTFEFDESLTFSGYGAAKNNLLVDIFLQNEMENKVIMRYYQKNPTAFANTLDSLRNVRKRIVVKASNNHDFSDKFKKIAKSAIDFDNYTRREYYPISHFENDKIKFIENLPEDFYDYREDINFNDADLATLYAYQRFLLAYFNHKAYMEYAKEEQYNTNSFKHNMAKMRAIDSMVVQDKARNYLLGRSATRFIANSNNARETDQIYKQFMEYSTSPQERSRVRDLYGYYKLLEAGNTIPNRVVLDFEGNEHKLHDLIKKKTIVYEWSTNKSGLAKRLHQRVEELREKFPDYDFIAVDIRDDRDTWNRTIKRYAFDPDQEYLVSDFIQARDDFLRNATSLAVIINEEGVFLNSHLNIFSKQFEEEMGKYLSQ